MPRITVVLGLFALGSCSQRTELSARFIDGEVAFVALRGNAVDCVQYLTVEDIATRETMWSLGGPPGSAACQAALPIRYGQSAAAVQQQAKPLRFGRRYAVYGSASGGNGLDGRFALGRATALRLTDLPWDEKLDEQR